jgi:hypothetical protein
MDKKYMLEHVKTKERIQHEELYNKATRSVDIPAGTIGVVNLRQKDGKTTAVDFPRELFPPFDDGCVIVENDLLEFIEENAPPKVVKMTDLDKFVALYKSFGIELTVEPDGDGYKNNPGGRVVRLHEAVDKRLAIGDDGIVSVVYFDKDGKFIEQGFWE